MNDFGLEEKGLEGLRGIAQFVFGPLGGLQNSHSSEGLVSTGFGLCYIQHLLLCKEGF